MAGDKICCASYVENGENMTEKDESSVHSDMEEEAKESPEFVIQPDYPEFEFSTSACYICNGYYGPCFGEPVCATCHAFLFPDDVGLLQAPIFSEKTDDKDSGNDEPVDLFYNTERRASQTDQNSSQDSTPLVSSPSDSPDQNRAVYFQQYNFVPARCNNAPANNDNAVNNVDQNNDDPQQNNPNDLRLDLNNLQIRQDVENFPQHDVLEEDFQSPEEDSGPVEEAEPDNHEYAGLFQPMRNYEAYAEKGEPSRPWNLSKRLDLLTNYKQIEHKSISEPGLVERLPPEVLLAVFSHLDDVSLWCAANVCRRWCNLLSTHITPDLWKRHVKLRWPLFKPTNGMVGNWYKAYDRLASSAPCKTCLSQTSLHHTRPPKVEENSWRRNRLRIELKGLRSDPPEGIEATPLDQMCCHWQATITGPAGSPYEGGVFYLYLQVPYSYPMRPPVVRFLTKILHPNVSRHGDVGIDSIHHNWSLALTISKVLISVQSLLTDPYCQVCMEPELGEMYMNDRARFEEVARAWTWKYAMHNVLEPS
ncbi:hypothetical protein TSAR_006675 [Trichomalopsis sarcophagae]|uniref:E2 ubiquitin-conjugating enzyme n=1 Tax=Trichomalopsis sarcophagae TaxID=543379 RepID=A0A232F3U2_9HYME|nr:hypothetical protein TSAR_006675 [Trichomalopsis sarcophagae]